MSYIVFLHQTTTEYVDVISQKLLSYIVFLHQTTTVMKSCHFVRNCLISSFYIKPQRCCYYWQSCRIVLYRLSTSNHNDVEEDYTKKALSYIVFLHQTTTPILNMNSEIQLSYIVFLHQTTTWSCSPSIKSHCLISSFYIKPQLLGNCM